MSAEKISNKIKDWFPHKREVAFVALLLGIVLILLCYSKITGIPFKSFTESDILAIITSLFVVAVFMERSIEAILIPIRAPDRQKIEQELEDIRKAAEKEKSAEGKESLHALGQKLNAIRTLLDDAPVRTIQRETDSLWKWVMTVKL